MKNKLEKKYLTKFDYKARRLGVVGTIIVAISFIVLIPISNTINHSNVALAKEIEQISENIENETEETNTILERK